MPNQIFYKLLEVCQEPGCPLCRIEQQATERYLDQHFYEQVNSPAWRAQLRDSLGFCTEHAWLGVDKRLGNALGYSIIYQDLINTLLGKLEEAHQEDANRSRLSKRSRGNLASQTVSALTPEKPCPVCQHGQATTRTVISVLLEHLDSEDLKGALQNSSSICLPHLRQIIDTKPQIPALKTLLTIQREKMKELRAELQEFIRKNDYRLSGSGFGSEKDAWLRAIALLVSEHPTKS